MRNNFLVAAKNAQSTGPKRWWMASIFIQTLKSIYRTAKQTHFPQDITENNISYWHKINLILFFSIVHALPPIECESLMETYVMKILSNWLTYSRIRTESLSISKIGLRRLTDPGSTSRMYNGSMLEKSQFISILTLETHWSSKMWFWYSGWPNPWLQYVCISLSQRRNLNSECDMNGLNNKSIKNLV